jgi:hypothetical protein
MLKDAAGPRRHTYSDGIENPGPISPLEALVHRVVELERADFIRRLKSFL